MLLRASCFLAMAMLVAAQDNPPGRGVNLYSYQKEAALGANLAQEFRNRTTALESDPVRKYVERIGARLAAQLSVTPVTYSFALVATHVGGTTSEPEAMPGGYVFVPADLLLACQSEAEFAGMLAHAMAHIAERHGTRLATRGQIANQAAIPLIFMGSWNGGDGLLMPAAFAKAQRAYELDADRLGVRMASGAGYDPGAIAGYIQRVQPASAGSDGESRLTSLLRATDGLPAPAAQPNDQFLAIQEQVRSLVAIQERTPPSLKNPKRP